MTLSVEQLFAQARQSARQALRERLEDERYLLGRELALLAVADEWGITPETFAGFDGGDTVARLRTAIGVRRERIRRLEAELTEPDPPGTEEAAE